MCEDFSGYITRSYQIVWERGISSHDELYFLSKEKYPELKEGSGRAVKFEITPDGGYLHPDKSWTFRIDEDEEPSWFSGEYKKEALRAHKQWKKEIYALINLKEARKPINPLTNKYKPTKKDIETLRQWASVRDSVGDGVVASVWAGVRDGVGASVGDSVWASVRASVGASVWAGVRDSVGDSVGAGVRAGVGASVGASVRDSVGDYEYAYFGSLFNVWGTEYRFQPAVDLWKRGFVASFDGKTWRLHSGPKAEIVWEGKL